MTPQELHELDGWLAEHVLTDDPAPMDVESPTQIPKDTLAVLEKCLEKCNWSIEFTKNSDGYHVWNMEESEHENYATDKCLKIAICLFAKEIFSRK